MDSEVNIELTTNESTQTIARDNEDYVVKCVGAFGPWQAGICFVASLTRFVSMWNMLSMLFLTPATSFICTKFESNFTSDVKNSTCYDNCEEYYFYKDILEETLVSEFKLICENAWLASLSQTILMSGVLVGVFLFGWISDRYGRRKALLSSSFINVALMLMMPFSPYYWVFVSIRFLIGVASGGTLTIGVVYILEIVGPQYRGSAGALAILPDGIAEASLSIFAYYASSWRIYSMGYAVVSLIFVMLMVLLPESPRWLMSKGKAENAIEVLTKIAKFNERETSQIEYIIYVYGVKNMTTTIINKPSYLDFFKSNFNLVTITIIWTSAGACFFGVNQYITFVGNDLLTSVVLLGLTQIPVCLIAVVVNKIFGRKVATISSLLTTGISMIILIFLPHDHWARTCLGVIGFAGCAELFNVIYVFTGELFPTSIRNMAYGIGTAGAKMGSMVVPFVVTLTPYWVPSLIFATLVIVSSVCCLLLPETKGRNLEDNS